MHPRGTQSNGSSIGRQVASGFLMLGRILRGPLVDSEITLPLGGNVVLLLLVAGGFAGNYFRFNVFFNADFIFGTIFTMLVLQIYGIIPGVAAALISSLPLVILWGHPYAIVYMTAEVAFVGWLHSRRKIGFVQADILFWILIGMPAVYICLHAIMGIPASNTRFIMAKSMVNGVVNILMARILFIGLARIRRKGRLSIHEAVYILLAIFVLVPALVLLGVGGREAFQALDRRAREELLHNSRSVTLRVDRWMENRGTAIRSLALLAASRSPGEMLPFLGQVRQSDENFLQVSLLDRQGAITASVPPADPSGPTSLGPHAVPGPPRRQQALQPVFTELFLDPAVSNAPRVRIWTPVPAGGGRGGFVCGVLTLDQIREHLAANLGDGRTLFTLMDPHGQVMITNRADQKVMSVFKPRAGASFRLDRGIQLWAPSSERKLADDWGRSFYVAESDIGAKAAWKLLLELPLAHYQQAFLNGYGQALFLVLLFLLLSLAAAELVSRQFGFAFEQLGNLSRDLPRRLTSGELPILWPDSGLQEGSILVANFREMTGKLTEQFIHIQRMNALLEQNAERERGHSVLLDRFSRAQAVIIECNQVIIRARDEQELLQEFCRISLKVQGVSQAWVGLALRDETRSIQPAASMGFQDGEWPYGRISWADDEFGRTPAGVAIRTGQVCTRIQKTPGGPMASMALPLLSERHAFGALVLNSPHADNFDQEPVQLLLELANNLSIGMIELRAKAERDQALHTAKRQADQLRSLALELSQTEQRERKHLAQLLHDHLQQSLVGATFKIETMKAQAKTPAARATLDELAEMIQNAIHVSRALTVEISPPVVRERKLTPCLEWLGTCFYKDHGLKVQVDPVDDVDSEPEAARMFIFEAVRELLLNVVKHARVGKALVRLRVLDSQEIEVTVEDHGVGFDLEKLDTEAWPAEGLGLFSLRERLRFLNGSMEIVTSPSRGCRCTMVVPVLGWPEDRKAGRLAGEAVSPE